MFSKLRNPEKNLRSRAWLLILAAGLALSACEDSGPVEVESRVAGQPNQPEMVASCENYGQAITNARILLKEREADQSQLPSKYARAVVVKTLYEPTHGSVDSTWLATIVESNGTVQVLRSNSHDNTTMAALVTPGDYIAFDNKDGDFKISAPQSRDPNGDKNNDELRFLGHGVLAC